MKIKSLGITDYLDTFLAMQAFTETRTNATEDEIWLTEHPAVFTQGRAGKPEHLLNPTDIPVLQSDRGGQITYHGLGQAVIYTLIDIRRAGIGVRDFVTALEQSAIYVLNGAADGINAYADPDAPGVYVQSAGVTHKIASLGIRVRKGATYHGIAINVDMDLTPFSYINPCGLIDMSVTQCRDLHLDVSVAQVQTTFANTFVDQLKNLRN